MWVDLQRTELTLRSCVYFRVSSLSIICKISSCELNVLLSDSVAYSESVSSDVFMVCDVTSLRAVWSSQSTEMLFLLHLWPADLLQPASEPCPSMSRLVFGSQRGGGGGGGGWEGGGDKNQCVCLTIKQDEKERQLFMFLLDLIPCWPSLSHSFSLLLSWARSFTL